jgi:hypothetical protein
MSITLPRLGLVLAATMASQWSCIAEAGIDVGARIDLPKDAVADCYLERLPAEKETVLQTHKLHPPDNPVVRTFLVSPVPASYRARVRCKGFKQVYTSNACSTGPVNRCGDPIDLGVLKFSTE